MSTQKFFLIVPPHFEDLALAELRWRGLLDTASGQLTLVGQVKGGLELEGEFEAGLAINRHSRLGVRVLWRLGSFRCRDFPKLFNKIKAINWRGVVGHTFDVEVSAHRSRLMNKKRIEKTVREAVEKALASVPAESEPAGPRTIYIRFDNDDCTVSLDTTGEGLFKRGYKTLEAVAPLRENLAAGLFWLLYDKAGRPAQFEIIDPLCGSGTFLTEAFTFFSNRVWRRFAMEEPSTNHPAAGPAVEMKLFGYDRHPRAVELARENVKAAKAEGAIIEQKDFLETSLPLPPPQGPRIGIANPPYGVRVRLPAPPTKFYPRLVEVLREAECELFGFIVPRRYMKYTPKPVATFDFKNGGMDVTFAVYSKDASAGS